jgi:hypothetical protein
LRTALPRRQPALIFSYFTSLARFRALALFGRRPPTRVDGLGIPTSENLHVSRHADETEAIFKPHICKEKPRDIARGSNTGVLYGFPLFECGFDGQKIFMLVIFGVLLDGSASPCESATSCWANGIFREHFRQRVRELMIKCRNVGVATHALAPIAKLFLMRSPKSLSALIWNKTLA